MPLFGLFMAPSRVLIVLIFAVSNTSVMLYPYCE